MRVALFLREHADAWHALRSGGDGEIAARENDAVERRLSDDSRQVLRTLRTRGATFLSELVKACALEGGAGCSESVKREFIVLLRSPSSRERRPSVQRANGSRCFKCDLHEAPNANDRCKQNNELRSFENRRKEMEGRRCLNGQLAEYGMRRGA